MEVFMPFTSFLNADKVFCVAGQAAIPEPKLDNLSAAFKQALEQIELASKEEMIKALGKKSSHLSKELENANDERNCFIAIEAKLASKEETVKALEEKSAHLAKKLDHANLEQEHWIVIKCKLATKEETIKTLDEKSANLAKEVNNANSFLHVSNKHTAAFTLTMYEADAELAEYKDKIKFMEKQLELVCGNLEQTNLIDSTSLGNSLFDQQHILVRAILYWFLALLTPPATKEDKMNHTFVKTVRCGNLVVIQHHATTISHEEEVAELTQERNDAYNAYALADEERIELQTHVKDAQNCAHQAFQQFEVAHEGYQRPEAAKGDLERGKEELLGQVAQLQYQKEMLAHKNNQVKQKNADLKENKHTVLAAVFALTERTKELEAQTFGSNAPLLQVL
ncbi:hypothetical protein CBOM_03520 [Ceraceosorus bombacis]|uniref:Uncharacterized protein n=1 Tax=Ceraceosorus bombacis TaxID=401625 RepID=A0A0N7L9Z8_9BASI|nr:hypothetical protein CBOM_03520 [Ceraceosorus bombacis]